jgi:hypothetical protein
VRGGAAERVPGVGLRGDDQHRDLGQRVIFRQQVGDGGDGALVANGAGFRGVLTRSAQIARESGCGMLGVTNMMVERSFAAGERRRDGS